MRKNLCACCLHHPVEAGCLNWPALMTVGIVIGLVITVPVTVAPVVVIVPISVRMPASLIWIPPSVIRVPASFADFPEFVTRVLSLLAFVAMIFDGFVQIVISPGDTLLAIISTDLLCSRQHQKPSQQCGCQTAFQK